MRELRTAQGGFGMRIGRRLEIRKLAWALAITSFAFSFAASAQVPEVRFARQFSMGYLQFNVMEREQLLEKHAKLNGIPDIKVT